MTKVTEFGWMVIAGVGLFILHSVLNIGEDDEEPEVSSKRKVPVGVKDKNGYVQPPTHDHVGDSGIFDDDYNVRVTSPDGDVNKVPTPDGISDEELDTVITVKPETGEWTVKENKDKKPFQPGKNTPSMNELLSRCK